MKLLKYKVIGRLGFTLIELLVVMTIIAVLAGLSLFALAGARESGRDARRKADLEHIASGIEIYKADCNYYPDSISVNTALDGGDAPCALPATNIYIQSVPDDPDSTRDYWYAPSGVTCPGNCTTFRLWAALENPSTMPTSCGAGPYPKCGTPDCNFCVTNP